MEHLTAKQSDIFTQELVETKHRDKTVNMAKNQSLGLNKTFKFSLFGLAANVQRFLHADCQTKNEEHSKSKINLPKLACQKLFSSC